MPLNYEDLNHKLVQDMLYSKVPILPKNIHTINYALQNDLEELTDAYKMQLIREFVQCNLGAFSHL
jgi:6-phosphogluconolactonase